MQLIKRESDAPGVPGPTSEMLARRRALVSDLYGLWSNDEGERIAKWIADSFGDAEPLPSIDDT